MAGITAKGGPLMAGPTQQILPDTWANQVWWPHTKTTLPDVLYTRAQTDALLKGKQPNLTGTYPIAPGQTIAAGDVVDVQADGSVGKALTPVGNVETILGNGAAEGTACINMGGLYSVVAFVFSGDLYFRLVTTSGNEVKQVWTSSVLASSASNVSLSRLSDTQFVVGYSYGGLLHAKVGTVSGTTITFGSEATINQANPGGQNPQPIIALSASKLLAFYASGGLKAHICTVSGTTITAGTQYSLTGSNPYYTSATLLPDDSSGNKRVCVCYSDAGYSNKGKAVIATIDSSNVVTWGTVATFENNATTAKSICAYDNGVVIAYVRSGVGIFISKCAISGAAISPAASSLLTESYGASPALLNIGGKIVMVSAPATPVSGYAAVLKPSGSTFALGDRYQFTTAGYPNYASLDVISDGRFMVSYARSSDLYGTATILTVYGDQIAGSFIDESSQAIALQSGTAGEIIEVIFDGVAELAGLSAGRKITSAGVYGYCPVDGVVWANPYWAGNTKVATGSYIGTGAYGSANPCSLTFGFVPKVVLIEARSRADSRTFPWLNGALYGNVDSISSKYNILSWDGNTLAWYSSTSYVEQLNISGEEYLYLAIG